jgi:hypothetical protein
VVPVGHGPGVGGRVSPDARAATPPPVGFDRLNRIVSFSSTAESPRMKIVTSWKLFEPEKVIVPLAAM